MCACFHTRPLDNLAKPVMDAIGLVRLHLLVCKQAALQVEGAAQNTASMVPIMTP